MFIETKTKRLLIPYVFTAVVWVVPISWYFYRWDAAELFKKYVLCVNPSQLWFLWMLFWIFVMAWPMWKWLSGSMYIGTALSLVLYGIGAVGNRIAPNVFCIWSAFQYIPFFYIGIRIWLRQETEEQLWITKIPILCWILADVLVFILDSMVEGGVIYFPGLGSVIFFALHIIGAVMAFVVLENIAERVNWRQNKVFSALTRYSMPMYLFHQQIIYFVIVWLNGKVNPYINASVNFAAIVVGLL